MSSKAIVTIEYIPLRGGAASVAAGIVFDTYDAFLAKFAKSLAELLGGSRGKRRDWQMAALTAQEALSPTSVVRRRKGYSILFLDDAVRGVSGLKLEDGSYSPKDGCEFLYTVASGSDDARMTTLRLGMCSAAAFVACGQDAAVAKSVKDSIGAGLVLSSNAVDTVGWDHLAVFKAIPSVLCVAGLVGLPLGPLHVRVCAEEKIGYRLQTMMSH